MPSDTAEALTLMAPVGEQIFVLVKAERHSF